MDKPVHQKFSFRQRGFQCTTCQFKTMVFGNDNVSVSCPNCNKNGTLKKYFDHLVTTQTSIVDTPPIPGEA